MRGDLITLYRVLRGELGESLLTFFTFDHRPNRRGHSWKLKCPAFDVCSRDLMFSARVVTAWNGLPERVVNAPSIKSFKDRLDEFFV